MNKLAKRMCLRLAALLLLCIILLLAPSGQNALVTVAPLLAPTAGGGHAFDGSGDYVTFDQALDLGQDTFTLEFGSNARAAVWRWARALVVWPWPFP